jgi:ubiquitin-conjugating enzyme E2 T
MSRLGRIKRELEMLATDPGPGISAWLEDDSNMMHITAQIQGPEDSPFEKGTYTLSLQIPDRYPLEPPSIRFVTPIYHPNIDGDGRICLDTLKMQPQGSWTPSININTILLTIRLLMATPNADDGLVLDITEEYKRDIILWRSKAVIHTRKYAMNISTTQSVVDEEVLDNEAIVTSGSSSSQANDIVHITSDIDNNIIQNEKDSIDSATRKEGNESTRIASQSQSLVAEYKDTDKKEENEIDDEDEGNSSSEEESTDDEEEDVPSMFADAPAAKRTRY